MTGSDLVLRLQGRSLTTAEILYCRPDAPSLLQVFAWQEYDLAPDFPALFDFLNYWQREIHARLHSVRIAHDQLVHPTDWRPGGHIIPLEGGSSRRGTQPKNQARGG